MENEADKALKSLTAIADAFSEFVAEKGKSSEADTRVKLIDRILKEVCLWPETALSREDHVSSGYTDYQLKIRHTPYVVVEAKREGIAFVLPEYTSQHSPTLKGALLTDPQVTQCICQVRQYCDDQGIKFAIATNGYTWIVFRAIRDDMPWRNGRARVFPSIEYIKKHFVQFWNLLSFESICSGSLDSEFGRLPSKSRSLNRVIDLLFNANLPLHRNRLNAQLQPLAKYIFEDIAGQEDVDLLNSCYVHTHSLRVVADDLDVVITDTIPKDIAFAGTKPLLQSADNAGEFDDALQRAVTDRQGQLYLLLGGIGSGKTTFLKRYEKIIAKDFLATNSFTFRVDFLKAPMSVGQLESFVWSTVLDILRTEYGAMDVEQRKYIKTIFKDKLKNLERTALRGVPKHTEEFEQAIGPYILKWQQDLSDYLPKLLRFACVMNKRTAVLFIDNVDQLDPEYQTQIFLLAQRITRLAASVTIIALREESYYASSIQNTFTAYTSQKFHIASPQFRSMIQNRIEYAIRALESHESDTQTTILHGHVFETKDICEFLRIVQASVLEWKNRIARFIECICFGNMRSALQMFTTFITSGATDVDKMLLIYRRDGRYNVAFHEFLKSVMLQDRAYYKEDQSPILNLFNCTSDRNSSHFTGMRVLALLLDHRGESNPEGRGYVELSRIVGFFADTFDNVQDLTVTMDRLVSRQLIEANTRSPATVSGASHLRVTAAGWYYLSFLSRTFAYLDLVLQDTPLNDVGLERFLRQSVYDVNNLSDREQEKEERMRVRFDRTQRFLDYLNKEENEEFERFDMDRLPSPLNIGFIPAIQAQFTKDRAYIERKLRDGRVVDVPDEPDDRISEQLKFEFLEDDLEVEKDRPAKVL
jgi:hypothetical protein